MSNLEFHRRQALRAAMAALVPAWPALAQATGNGTGNATGTATATAAAQADPSANAATSAGRAAPLRLATAWRVADPAGGSSADRVGVIEIDWAVASVRIAADVPVPSRAHGLLPLADGGFMAVANRPGRWLMRCDAAGGVVKRISIDDEKPRRTFNGHVEASGAIDAGGRGDSGAGNGRSGSAGSIGAWFFTTETDPATGEGWISVRDARTLARVAEFASGGRDPHQLLRAPDGSLLVAIGGIVRDLEGKAVQRERMEPALVRLASHDGKVAGRWTLPDPRLSVRHIAWAQGPRGLAGTEPGLPLLGIALQAEHDRDDERRAAPTLAVWNGETFAFATRDASAGGYAGDIAAGPGGGFVISAQKARRGLWWHPGQPERLTTIAELTEPCALATIDEGAGVLLSAGRGAALWHARGKPGMLPWPVALAPDNHWVVLRAG